MTNCIYFKNHLNCSVSNLTDLVDISIICDKESTKKKKTQLTLESNYTLLLREISKEKATYMLERFEDSCKVLGASLIQSTTSSEASLTPIISNRFVFVSS